MKQRARRPALTDDQVRRVSALDRVPREIFALLAESETPLKPYELLGRLQSKRGRSAPPSTVYRGAATLIEAGLVHRIESLGAFVICTGPKAKHEPMFLCCTKCHKAFEISADATKRSAKEEARRAAFRVDRLDFVIYGICASCRSIAGGR